MKALFFVSLIALCGAANVSATTLHVPSEYPTILAAITASATGDTVLLASGTYTGWDNTYVSVNRAILITSETGNPADVIIDGEMREERFAFDLEADVTIRGVTVTRMISGGGTYGAIRTLIGSDDIRIINCVVSWCRNGAIYIGAGYAAIEGCVIENNDVGSGNVSAVTCQNNSVLHISRTTVRNNYNTGDGGGVKANDATVVIDNCVISHNTADWGGGIDAGGGTITISNTAIVANHASPIGGGMYVSGTNMTLINVTVAGNSASNDGGPGIFAHTNTRLHFDHTVVWGNIGGDIKIENATVTASCSDFPDDTPDDDNISTDPLFCDPSNGDYSLWDVSPALHQTCGPMGAYIQPGCVTPTAVQPTTWSAIKAQYR